MTFITYQHIHAIPILLTLGQGIIEYALNKKSQPVFLPKRPFMIVVSLSAVVQIGRVKGTS